VHRDPRRPLTASLLAFAAALAAALAACAGAAPGLTPAITPGTSAAPREVNIIARDYAYVPSTVDLVPGETVIFHVINGGLEIHEAILGDLNAQLAWEQAELATVGAPPGPTPLVPAPSGFDGTRIVVASGQRLDVTWTVPSDATKAASGWFVGCHIPGHWAKGMVVPVRFVDAAGSPIGSPASLGSPAASSASPAPAAPAVSPATAGPVASGG
jgi:uncharacterized cupredoxin-like copper-binding protein